MDRHSIEQVDVPVTSPAKTVADCFKYRSQVGLDVAIEALRDSLRSRRATVDDLWRFAAIDRVQKVQAVVALGMLNSRMKDFFDLWGISETFSFGEQVLAHAIATTFDRRRTATPADTPDALTQAFAEDAAKQAQWRGFLRRTALAMAPGLFVEMQAKVAAFVLRPARALAAGRPFEHKWIVGGPWS